MLFRGAMMIQWKDRKVPVVMVDYYCANKSWIFIGSKGGNYGCSVETTLNYFLSLRLYIPLDEIKRYFPWEEVLFHGTNSKTDITDLVVD